MARQRRLDLPEVLQRNFAHLFLRQRLEHNDASMRLRNSGGNLRSSSRSISVLICRSAVGAPKPSGFVSLRKCSDPTFEVMITIASDR